MTVGELKKALENFDDKSRVHFEAEDDYPEAKIDMRYFETYEKFHLVFVKEDHA